MAEEKNKNDDSVAESDDTAQSKMSGKKLVLFIVLPVILLLGGVAGFFLLSSEEENPEELAQVQQEEIIPETAIFYDLPEFVVNLSAAKKQRTRYLKMIISLEYGKEETGERIMEMLPRIIDSVNVYARELRISDIEGSAGLFQLKEALFYRINLMISPSKIQDVLFKQILVQ